MTTENLLDDYSLIAAEQARPLPIHARNSEGHGVFTQRRSFAW